MDTPAIPAAAPFNGGAPLNQDQIQKIRAQAGVNMNPSTASAGMPVNDRLAALKAGSYSSAAPTSQVPTGQPTMLGNVIRGAIRPIARGLMSVQNAGETIAGKPLTESAAGSPLGDYLAEGTDKPIERVGAGFDPSQGFTPENIEALRDAVHQGVDIGTLFAGGEGVVDAGASTAGKIGAGALEGAKTGALVGGIQGGSSIIDKDATVGSTIKNTVEGVAGGALAGGIGGGVASGLPAAAKVLKDGASDVGSSVRQAVMRTPENISGAARDLPQVKQTLHDALQHTQDFTRNKVNQSAPEAYGNRLGQDLIGTSSKEKGVYDTLINDSRTAKDTAIKQVGDEPMEGLEHLNDTWKDMNDSPIRGVVSNTDSARYRDFQAELQHIAKGKATIQEVDRFVDEWQSQLYGKNSIQNSNISGRIEKTVGMLNEDLKSHMDSLGLPEYRESNTKLSGYLQHKGFLEDQLGDAVRSSNGGPVQYNNASNVTRQLASGESPMWREISNDIGKPIHQEAAIHQFFEDLRKNPKNALANLPTTMMGSGLGFVLRTIRSKGLEYFQSPEVMEKFLQEVAERGARATKSSAAAAPAVAAPLGGVSGKGFTSNIGNEKLF